MTALVVTLALFFVVWCCQRRAIRIRFARNEHNIHHLLHQENRTMAKLTDVNGRLDTLEAHAGQIPDPQPPQPAPAATEAELDVVVARLDALDATLQTKIPPPAG